MDREMLTLRALVFREIRAFFDRRHYLEVDTPLLAPDLIPESCLEVFETAYLPPPGSRNRQKKPYWLIPSPEIWMKRLIAQHRTSLYQICRCFRNGESLGRLHSPEFTMLEYYTMDGDYRDSLLITEELMAALLDRVSGSGKAAPPEPRPPFFRLTMAEAFERWAGFDLFRAAREGSLEAEARRLGLDPPADTGPAELYDLIFIHTVEPALPRDRPVVLLDYPAFVPCLAQKSPGGETVERWELYIGGIELANCYSEETSPDAVRRYFEAEGSVKNKKALTPHHIDPDYWKLFLPRRFGPDTPEETPFPRCSGVALGLDRLLMVLSGRLSIDGTLPFPMGPIQ
jgi:lysyl-tRNA synthetase class 2